MVATADTEAHLLNGLSAEKDSQHTAACGEIKGCMLIHRRQGGFRLPSALHSTRVALVPCLRTLCQNALRASNDVL